MNFLKRVIIFSLFLSGSAYADFTTLNARILTVSVDNVIGTGPHLRVEFDKSITQNLCGQFDKTVAMSLDNPLAESILSIALTAKTTKELVHVYTKDSCAETNTYGDLRGLVFTNGN